MLANEMQVGGQHYKTTFEHWDLVLDVGMGYFEGCSTKYVCRWRKKEGVNSIKKALHFLNKLEENWVCEATIQTRPSVPYIQDCVRRFAEANKLTDVERAFIEAMCTWRTGQDLDAAREILFLILEEAESAQYGDGPRPAPLTEENHYSEREGDDSAGCA